MCLIGGEVSGDGGGGGLRFAIVFPRAMGPKAVIHYIWCPQPLISRLPTTFHYSMSPPPIRRGVRRARRRYRQGGIQKLANRPSMAGEAKRLSGVLRIRLVPTAQAVVDEVQGHGGSVVFYFL